MNRYAIQTRCESIYTQNKFSLRFREREKHRCWVFSFFFVLTKKNWESLAQEFDDSHHIGLGIFANKAMTHLIMIETKQKIYLKNERNFK